MVPPTEADLAANAAAGAAVVDDRPGTPSGWFGFVEGRQCLMDGVVLESLRGVPSSEACARACQAWQPTGATGDNATLAGSSTPPPPQCNLFNYCPANRTEPCRRVGTQRRHDARGPRVPNHLATAAHPTAPLRLLRALCASLQGGGRGPS